jgi:hypothetical protein
LCIAYQLLTSVQAEVVHAASKVWHVQRHLVLAVPAPLADCNGSLCILAPRLQMMKNRAGTAQDQPWSVFNVGVLTITAVSCMLLLAPRLQI